MVLAAITTALTMFIAIVGVPKILSGASTSAAISAGNDVSGCRAEYASKVTEATSGVSLLVLDLIAAGRDPKAQAEIRKNAALLRVELATAITAYRATIKQARDDPEAFRAACVKRFG